MHTLGQLQAFLKHYGKAFRSPWIVPSTPSCAGKCCLPTERETANYSLCWIKTHSLRGECNKCSHCTWLWERKEQIACWRSCRETAEGFETVPDVLCSSQTPLEAFKGSPGELTRYLLILRWQVVQLRGSTVPMLGGQGWDPRGARSPQLPPCVSLAVHNLPLNHNLRTIYYSPKVSGTGVRHLLRAENP